MSASRGFTLLEVMVGLALIGLLTLAMHGGFQLAVRSWESAQTTSDAATRMRLVSGFINRYLSVAQTVSVKVSNRTRLEFEGGKEQLRFVTEMPAYLGVGGLYELTLRVVQGTDSKQLVVTRSLFGAGTDSSAEKPDESVLIEDLSAATFTYFGTPKRRAPREWHDEWVDAQHLPTLVRLRVETDHAGVWPELIVRLLADGRRVRAKVIAAEPAIRFAGPGA